MGSPSYRTTCGSEADRTPRETKCVDANPDAFWCLVPGLSSASGSGRHAAGIDRYVGTDGGSPAHLQRRLWKDRNRAPTNRRSLLSTNWDRIRRSNRFLRMNRIRRIVAWEAFRRSDTEPMGTAQRAAAPAPRDTEPRDTAAVAEAAVLRGRPPARVAARD